MHSVLNILIIYCKYDRNSEIKVGFKTFLVANTTAMCHSSSVDSNLRNDI